MEIEGEGAEDNRDGDSGEIEEGDVVGGAKITVRIGEKARESVLILAEPVNKLLGIEYGKGSSLKSTLREKINLPDGVKHI